MNQSAMEGGLIHELYGAPEGVTIDPAKNALAAGLLIAGQKDNSEVRPK
jgi:hypothetical protein